MGCLLMGGLFTCTLLMEMLLMGRLFFCMLLMGGLFTFTCRLLLLRSLRCRQQLDWIELACGYMLVFL